MSDSKVTASQPTGTPPQTTSNMSESSAAGSRPAGIRSQFATDIFTLLVGPGKVHFNVHQAILSKHSTVFHRMCTNQSFPESQEKLIKLPEEDPKSFTYILNYMYGGDFAYPSPGKVQEQRNAGVFQYPTKKQIDSHLDRLADLYLVADRYDIDPLKRLVTTKMWPFAHGDAESCKHFVEVGSRIIDAVPSTDRIFAEFLIHTLSEVFSKNKAWNLTFLNNYFREGGEIAVLLGRALRRAGNTGADDWRNNAHLPVDNSLFAGSASSGPPATNVYNLPRTVPCPPGCPISPPHTHPYIYGVHDYFGQSSGATASAGAATTLFHVSGFTG